MGSIIFNGAHYRTYLAHFSLIITTDTDIR